MNRTVASALCLLLAFPAAPSQAQGWQWQRTVVPATATTDQCVVLDADLYARSAPGLRDLRLLQGGREVAYALEESFDDEVGGSTVSGDRSQYTTVLTIPLAPAKAPARAGSAAYGQGVLLRHVPVERMTLVTEKAGKDAPAHAVAGAGYRLRLSAVPVGTVPVSSESAEVIEAALPAGSRVLQTAIGANLQDDAAVSVAVQPAPAVASQVLLQMRQRSLCFLPIASTPMVLRFGNPAARPVHYDYAAHCHPVATPVLALLGPVERNPLHGAEAPRRGAGVRASLNAIAGLAAAALLLLMVPVLSRRRSQPPQ